MRTAILVVAVLLATSAHAGRLSGHVSPNAPSGPEVCDTLGTAVTVAHRVHGRIMHGTTKAWEDSVSAMPGTAWELFYQDLPPGNYQAISWTTKPTNALLGCPQVADFSVQPAYSIIFGWNTVGAVYDTQEQRVIGMAEMLRRLQACDSMAALPR